MTRIVDCFHDYRDTHKVEWRDGVKAIEIRRLIEEIQVHHAGQTLDEASNDFTLGTFPPLPIVCQNQPWTRACVD